MDTCGATSPRDKLIKRGRMWPPPTDWNRWLCLPNHATCI